MSKPTQPSKMTLEEIRSILNVALTYHEGEVLSSEEWDVIKEMYRRLHHMIPKPKITIVRINSVGITYVNVNGHNIMSAHNSEITFSSLPEDAKRLAMALGTEVHEEEE